MSDDEAREMLREVAKAYRGMADAIDSAADGEGPDADRLTMLTAHHAAMGALMAVMRTREGRWR